MVVAPSPCVGRGLSWQPRMWAAPMVYLLTLIFFCIFFFVIGTLYEQVLKTQLAAKKEGFADVVYLDAVSNKYIEEVSSCNIFVIKVGTRTLTVMYSSVQCSTALRSKLITCSTLSIAVSRRCHHPIVWEAPCLK